MPLPLRVLLLEDDTDDAELLLDELCQSGFDPQWKRVDNEHDYLESLDSNLELILADYNLPQFDAPSALRLLQERRLNIPFIVVTGAVSEEVVVECMKLGAVDYLLKDRLSRLGLAVTHALEQHRLSVAERQAEEDVRASRQMLQLILDSIPNGVFWKDRESRFLGWNRAASRAFGFTNASDIVGKTDADLPGVTSDQVKWFVQKDREVLDTGQPQYGLADGVTFSDGILHSLETTKVPLRDAAGQIIGVLGIWEDVTKRKQADEQIRAALRENETLLREVHHRVKNNLAIIDNILELQASKLHEPLLVEVFRDCQNRIHSMVAIHDQLYRARDFGSLDFGAYAAELCSRLFQSYGVDPSRIRLQLDLAPVPLDLNRAVPLGLLLNELVSNTLKHAFPDGRRGAVTVRLRLESDGRVHFTVADDGIGLPPNLDLKQRHSLGLQLIQLLSRQVGGAIAFDRERGTTVHLTFSHAPPGVYARDNREDETKSAAGRGRRASGPGAVSSSGNDGI